MVKMLKSQIPIMRNHKQNIKYFVFNAKNEARLVKWL